jgi:hypothetical protein
MVENSCIILSTAISSTWKYICGSICYLLELKLHINVKYHNKEYKYFDSFELTCVKITFSFLNIFITAESLLLPISFFHHEIFVPTQADLEL